MIVVGTLLAWGYAARQTYLEQVRILGQQMPIVAGTVANALEPDTDPPETIRRVLSGLQATPDSAAIVIDGAGHMLGSSGPAAVIAARAPGSMPKLSQVTDVDGVERVWGVERRADGRLIVALARPTWIAFDRAMAIYRRNTAISAIAVTLVLIVLSVVVGRTSRGLKRLQDVAARVGAGDLTAPTRHPMPSRELDQLQAQMIDMITRVRDLQQQVVRQERLAAIGTLVSGVAHEISNPLQAILGSTEVMQARPDLSDQMRADLAVIRGECVRAGAIIRNLTRFTRQQPAGPSAFALSDVVQWLSDLWERRLIEQNIHFEVDDRSTRQAHAVATEIQQVALNFLVNAEYAVSRGAGPGQKVIVRTRDTINGFVRLEVEDTGPGVDPADEPQLFVPFFTTKPVGEGTGLGLSVSYGIIHSHGGCIGYERGPLGGALFYFEIPATPPGAQKV